MESTVAVERLSALAQESRLGIFRLLVRAGAEGLAAGEIGRNVKGDEADIPISTLSAHLAVLLNAGLVQRRTRGRERIYSVQYGAVRDLMTFLVEDCCQGRPEICSPLAGVLAQVACCEPPSGVTA